MHISPISVKQPIITNKNSNGFSQRSSEDEVYFGKQNKGYGLLKKSLIIAPIALISTFIGQSLKANSPLLTEMWTINTTEETQEQKDTKSLEGLVKRLNKQPLEVVEKTKIKNGDISTVKTVLKAGSTSYKTSLTINVKTLDHRFIVESAFEKLDAKFNPATGAREFDYTNATLKKENRTIKLVVKDQKSFNVWNDTIGLLLDTIRSYKKP